MKNAFKIIIIALLLFIPLANTHGQMKADSSKRMKNSSGSSTKPEEEYASMDKGKMIEYTNNEWGYLTGDFTCSNGDKVSDNGTLTKANGSTVNLNNGDKVYRDGHMTSTLTASKSKPVKSHK